MTKSQAKAAALRWLDEATSGGRLLEDETTADLADRMNHLLAGAVAAVCGQFPRSAVYTASLAGAANADSWVPLTMPANFARLQRVLYTGQGAALEPFSEYRQLDEKSYAVPGTLQGRLDFYYQRHPSLPDAAAPEDTPLDVDEAAVPLVPLRLAADLLTGVDETAALAGYLNQRFTQLAAGIYRSPAPAAQSVECVYGY